MAQKRTSLNTQEPVQSEPKLPDRVYCKLLKPVSPVINGVTRPRSLVPGQELQSVLTGIEDAQDLLDELRRGKISERNLLGLCDAMTVLDAAREILKWHMDKK